jgi:hypothetical protein
MTVLLPDRTVEFSYPSTWSAEELAEAIADIQIGAVIERLVYGTAFPSDAS